IPFADHGALLDPPTADLTARCISALAQMGYTRDHPAIARALAFLRREQEEDGSWFGRWGTNYIYGTWSVLSALNAIGEDMTQPYVRKAVRWLESRQQADGGWGESCGSYWPERRNEAVPSTPSQTAWALLGLMAAGEVASTTVARGVDYLRRAPRHGARWDEELYNAVGFPRVFYLRYHGYSAYFPLWALARYQNRMARNDRRVACGMCADQHQQSRSLQSPASAPRRAGWTASKSPSRSAGAARSARAPRPNASSAKARPRWSATGSPAASRPSCARAIC